MNIKRDKNEDKDIKVEREEKTMTKKEAIGYALTACRNTWNGNMCEEIEELLFAPSKVESSLAEERYKDLCEFFKNDKHLIKTILGSRAEFNNWLERMRWNAKKVNELFEENEKLTALLLKQKTDYPFKEGESLFSPKQPIYNEKNRSELYSRDIDMTVFDKAWELEKKEEKKEPEFVTEEQQ